MNYQHSVNELFGPLVCMMVGVRQHQGHKGRKWTTANPIQLPLEWNQDIESEGREQ